MAGVGCKSLRNDQEGIGKRADAVFRFALRFLLESFAGQSCGAGYLECAGAGHDAFVDDHVVYAAQTVADGVFDLRDGVGIGTFDEQGDGACILDVLL